MSHGDKLFTTVCFIIVTMILLIVAYPLYFVVIASFSDPLQVSLGNTILLPQGFNLDGYEYILHYNDIWIGYRNTIIYTVLGTLLNLFLTLTAGYALSRRNLKGRRVLMGLLTFTMYFSGGMIPTYQIVSKVGLVNNPLSMIIVGAVGVYYIIITRTFMESNIPEELHESAQLDNCDDFNFFVRIVLPLSPAIIAVLTIYYAVGHWNAYFPALLYLRDRSQMPLQMFLREILVLDRLQEAENALLEKDVIDYQYRLMSMKYGAIIVSSLPVLMLYPFVQKYFVKGVIIGAIKG